MTLIEAKHAHFNNLKFISEINFKCSFHDIINDTVLYSHDHKNLKKILKKLFQNSLTQHILTVLLFHFVIMIQILSLSLHLSQCMTIVLTYLLLHCYEFDLSIRLHDTSS